MPTDSLVYCCKHGDTRYVNLMLEHISLKAFFRSVLILTSLLVLACVSFAGYYTVSYSGSGTTTIDWISGGYTYPGPYVPPNMGSGSVAPTGSVYCRGPITATLTWVPNPGIPNDQPPSFIVVEESGSAMWTGDSGNCSDGLGDSEIDTTNNSSTAGPNQGVSSGNHYFVISNPGTSYPITVSPTAFGYGSSSGSDEDSLKKGKSTPPFVSDGKGTPIQPPYPRGRVNASVSFSVSTWTPSLELTSITTGPEGSWNVQIGTPETAFLIWTDMNGNTLQQLPNPLACNQYNWNVPGVTFASWNASLTSATLVPVTWADASSQSFTWADGNGSCAQGYVNVQPSVTFNIQNNGASIGIGQINLQVKVWRPYSQQLTAIAGNPEYTFPGPTYISSGGNGFGCEMNCNVGVSSVFGTTSSGFGAGSVNWCQLVNLDNTALGGIYTWGGSTGGQYLLDSKVSDTTWTYNASNQNCVTDQNWPDGAAYDIFDDTPQMPLSINVYGQTVYASSWVVNYGFENWVMYQPNDGVWVPLLYSTWYWDDSGSPPYANPPGGQPPGLGTQGLTVDDFPQWSGQYLSPG